MVMFAVLVVMLVAFVEQPCAAEPLVVRVNKCCPLHQQLALNKSACLDYDYEKYELTRAARSTPPPPSGLPWWVSEELRVETPSRKVVPAAKVTWLANPAVEPGCPASRRSLLMQNLEQFTVTPDGRLLVYGGPGDDDGGEDEDDVVPLQLPAGAFCLDRIKDEGRLVALTCECSADSAWCWRRCCPEGYKLALADQDRVHQDAECEEEEEEGSQPHRSWLPKPPGMRRRQVFGFPECEEGEHIAPSDEQLPWRVLANGSALVEGVARAQPLDQYCADPAGQDGRGQLLYCSAQPVSWAPNSQKGLLYGLLFGLGAVFLLLTILIYSCLPGLLARMHARVVVCHAASLLGAYVALAMLQAWPDMPLPACSATAFIVQYSFLAAFLWLNVMCLDISWTFSGLRSLKGAAWDGDCRFWAFSAYAWGGAALVCAVTAGVEFSHSVPKGSTFKPDFGAVRCWFRGWEATLLYFYGPMAVLLLCNLYLFTYTAVRILTMHKETQILRVEGAMRSGKTMGRSVYRKERQRLSLYTKLFGLMGLTWVTEIVSWAVGGPEYYWYLPDLVNLLRAVFLFYLFCCKRSVLRLLRSRLPSCCPYSLPASEGVRSGSVSSKSKTDSRSRSLTSQQTTSFKLSELQVLELTQQHWTQLESHAQPHTQTLPQQANGHATNLTDTTPQTQLRSQQANGHATNPTDTTPQPPLPSQRANSHTTNPTYTTPQPPLPSQQANSHTANPTDTTPQSPLPSQQANSHTTNPKDTTPQTPLPTQETNGHATNLSDSTPL